MNRSSITASLLGALALSAWAQPEAFEVGPRNVAKLPGGKEADGIIGDFVLRNDMVEAVISHNAPLRRANMSTFYGADGVTPGCLYDLAPRGSNNDQITIFAPLDQRGPVSYVRITDSGDSETAAVETVLTAPTNDGLYKRHAYLLRDGWSGVLVVTTLRNESGRRMEIKTADRVTNFLASGKVGAISWYDAVDPADRAGYAHAYVAEEGASIPGETVSLAPKQEIILARFLAVGQSAAEAVGIVARRRGEAGAIKGTVRDSLGQPVATAAVHFVLGTKEKPERLPGYTNAQGEFEFAFPEGRYDVEVRDHGRGALTQTWQVKRGESLDLDLSMDAASAVEFDVRDEAGQSIPCKAQFLGVDGTKSPDLGPHNRAHGCKDQYHSEKGRFRVALDPGAYEIVVTRGVEFSHLSQRIKLEKGQTAKIAGALKRLVNTTGWISADFHNHSTPSGDNTCGTDDRLINLAAEQIEFAPTTEHNRLYDWAPHIEKLGLSQVLKTIPGMELTGSGPHLNSFPFQPKPYIQDNGAPVWNADPRVTSITLRDHQNGDPTRWAQINHPDMVEDFIDRDGDGRIDGGYAALSRMIDAIETQNYQSSEILHGAPYRIVKDPDTLARRIFPVREFIWLQLLNQGHRMWGVAVCDAHSVHGNGVGGWRTYLPSSTDEPALLDWKELSRNAKAGRMILSSGPFLTVETEDGTLPGGQTRVDRVVSLKVKVQCADWIDVDRVQVLVNGAQVKHLNFTRETHPDWFGDGVVKFDRVIEAPLSQDSHLIVVAIGEKSTLAKGFGSSDQAKIHPCAYSNPIFVDVDGGGFQHNGDLLGHPLPVKNMTIGQVEAMLGK